MIHTSFTTYVTVAFIAAGIVLILLRLGRRPGYGYLRPRPIVGTSVKAGLAAAFLLTFVVAAVGHAALGRNAANAHTSVVHILASGFEGTFAVVTVVALVFLAARRR